MNDDFEFPAMDLGVARNKGYAFVFVCLLSVYVVYVCEQEWFVLEWFVMDMS